MGRDEPRRSRGKKALTVNCTSSDMCILWRDGTRMQHSERLGTRFQQWQETCTVNAAASLLNHLTPNVNYSGRTAPLTSKVAFYIFIQQI